MSEQYIPGPGVEPDDTFATALLSQRDLSLSVPVNFVTQTGVSLSTACFAQNTYEDDAAADCLSNLIAIGFRRFDLDLYWDQERRLWSFCPVAIPSVLPPSDLPPTTTIDGSSALRSVSTSLSRNSTQSASVGVRQVASSDQTPTPLPTLATTNGGIFGNVLPTISSIPETPDTPVIRIGPYVCSNTINLSSFTSLIFNYIRKTETTINASLIYMILNLHAASTFDAPTSSAPQPTRLPSSAESVGSIFGGDLYNYIYKADQLRNERQNLNASWYITNARYRPVESYYNISTTDTGIVSTENGWPSESYIEFQRSQRLLLGWGRIDPQMAAYNFTGDSEMIFDDGFIVDVQNNVSVTQAGDVTNGCFLRDGNVDVVGTNNSWAVSYGLPNFRYPTSSSADLGPLLELTGNITACGITPILNSTLLSRTANQDIAPYLAYSAATIWSWEPNQPTNDTTTPQNRRTDSSNLDTTTSSTQTRNRCASTNPLTGNWAVSDCSTRYPAACRSVSSPYNWTLTPNSVTYSSATDACADLAGYAFAVPRTALENSYLIRRIREGEDSGKERGRIWVDFNSLDAEGCWVTGGARALCPYGTGSGFEDELARRTILVPTIAAVIVLIITALTVFVKVAGNRKTRRRTRKRKKRAENGFVYEGVPS